MPTFIHGRSTTVYIAGYDASANLRSTTYQGMNEPADVTTYGQSDKAFIPGLSATQISHEGVYSSGTAEAETWLGALTGGTAEPWTVYVGGDTFGNAGYAHPVVQTAYAITDEVADAVKFTVEGTGTGVAIDRVVSIRALATATGTAAGTNHDNTVGTNNGCAAYLHVISGTCSAGTVIVEHSTDGATGWATLATFTFAGTAAVGGIGAQYAEASGTVRRYVRHNVTDLAGTVRFAVGFARH